MSKLAGDVFFITHNQQAIASEQIALLKAIDDSGSITKAAKQIGISYRTAWDRVETMNNLSDSPLVVRSVGGAKGGGTALTALGQRIITGFQTIQQQHQQFIEQLGSQVDSFTDIANFMKNQKRKTSARNQFHGTITNIIPGAVNVEVHLDIGASAPLIAMVTQDSVSSLQLGVNNTAIALIKASSVIISKDTAIATSARNKLTGQISRLITGAVNSDIVIELAEGKSISAIISNDSVAALALKQGDKATALFKASSVILMND